MKDLNGRLYMCERPFPHFHGKKCLESDKANALLRWFETGVQWRFHRSHFFQLFESHLADQQPPTGCRWLFDDNWLTPLRTRVGRLLGARLDERVLIVGHRLVPGQELCIHNDEPATGTETHRLLIQLNHGLDSDDGGDLLFFDRYDPGAVYRVWRPIHNSCVGFALSHRSFHAVTKIVKRVRYTLVISFWRAKRSHTGGKGE
jgi:hypothetical protein